MKIAATANKIIATVPEIMFAKNNPAITSATIILTTLSNVFKFFFIVFYIKLIFNYCTNVR